MLLCSRGEREREGTRTIVQGAITTYEIWELSWSSGHVCAEPPNEVDQPKKKKVLKQLWKPTEKVTQKEPKQKATEKGIQVEREVNVIFDLKSFTILTATPVRNSFDVFASRVHELDRTIPPDKTGGTHNIV
ncbi:hypothetical protein HAX54_020208 [Datura stramonium]|uniref:Uncharacterized protein n=1 Tax=Datura stramonium TaxID=4076 RepID=A0ABS8UQS5_DATST|nr:hypothetical protein [Datura stramonium]